MGMITLLWILGYLLYRSCVIPVALYGARVWSYQGARTKGHLELLRKMQRKAALWITGAFCTTPGGAAESIAGLPPIHLLLRRLVDRGYSRANTLMPSHPMLGLATRPYVGEVQEGASPQGRVRVVPAV